MDRFLSEARERPDCSDRYRADHIGLRYPTELGLVGDVKTTLTALAPLLQYKAERSFLTEAQQRMRDWMKLLDQVEAWNARPCVPKWWCGRSAI